MSDCFAVSTIHFEHTKLKDNTTKKKDNVIDAKKPQACINEPNS